MADMSFRYSGSEKTCPLGIMGKLKELGFVMMQKVFGRIHFHVVKELAVGVTHAFEVEPYVQFHEAYDISHRS